MRFVPLGYCDSDPSKQGSGTSAVTALEVLINGIERVATAVPCPYWSDAALSLTAYWAPRRNRSMRMSIGQTYV